MTKENKYFKHLYFMLLVFIVILNHNIFTQNQLSYCAIYIILSFALLINIKSLIVILKPKSNLALLFNYPSSYAFPESEKENYIFLAENNKNQEISKEEPEEEPLILEEYKEPEPLPENPLEEEVITLEEEKESVQQQVMTPGEEKNEASEDEVILLEEEKGEKESELQEIMVVDEENSKGSEDEVLVLEEVEEEKIGVEAPSVVTEQKFFVEQEPEDKDISGAETVVEKRVKIPTIKPAVPEKPKVSPEEDLLLQEQKMKDAISSFEEQKQWDKLRDLLKEYLRMKPGDKWAESKLFDVEKLIVSIVSDFLNEFKVFIAEGKIKEIELKCEKVSDLIRNNSAYKNFEAGFEQLKQGLSASRQGKMATGINCYKRAIKNIGSFTWLQEQLDECVFLLRKKRKGYMVFWIILFVITLLAGGALTLAAYYKLEDEDLFLMGLIIAGSSPVLLILGWLTSKFIRSVYARK